MIEFDEGPKVGPTGRYVRPPLGSDDRGEIAVAITTLHGMVILDLGQTGARWLALPPDDVPTLVAALQQAAERARRETPP